MLGERDVVSRVFRLGHEITDRLPAIRIARPGAVLLGLLRLQQAPAPHLPAHVLTDSCAADFLEERLQLMGVVTANMGRQVVL